MPEAKKEEGLELLRVAVKACKIQMKIGNLFILEHPAGASSWATAEIKSLTSMEGVTCLVLDQCMYGLESENRQGVAPAQKKTRIVTNMWGAEAAGGKQRPGRAHGQRTPSPIWTTAAAAKHRERIPSTLSP